MSRQILIQVHGTQHKNIDPALLTQAMILWGPHLHHQRPHQHNHQVTQDATASQDYPPARHHEELS